MHVGLDCQLREGKNHTGKDIDDNLLQDQNYSILLSGCHTYLLADTAWIPPEYNISSEQPGHERIISALFPGPRRIQVSQGNHRALINCSKRRQVPGVLSSGFQDEFDLLLDAIRTQKISVRASGSEE